MTSSSSNSWLYRNSLFAATHARLMQYEFDLFDELRQEVDSAFSSKLEAFQERFAKAQAASSPEDFEYEVDNWAEEFHRLEEELPNLQWTGQFIATYAAYESMLNKLCDVGSRRMSSNLSFKDFAGSGIERAKIFLTKVCSMTAPFASQSWNDARMLGEVRNLIAHSAGKFSNPPSKKHEALLQWLQKVPGAPLSNSQEELKLNSTFLAFAIEKFRAVINEIAHTKIDSLQVPSAT